MTNSPEFLNACKLVQTLPSKPSDDVLCCLYGLYKQATCGNNTSEKPSFLYYKALAKWNAWESVKNKSIYEAEVGYILLVSDLLSKR